MKRLPFSDCMHCRCVQIALVAGVMMLCATGAVGQVVLELYIEDRSVPQGFPIAGYVCLTNESEYDYRILSRLDPHYTDTYFAVRYSDGEMLELRTMAERFWIVRNNMLLRAHAQLVCPILITRHNGRFATDREGVMSIRAVHNLCYCGIGDRQEHEVVVRSDEAYINVGTKGAGYDVYAHMFRDIATSISVNGLVPREPWGSSEQLQAYQDAADVIRVYAWDPLFRDYIYDCSSDVGKNAMMKEFVGKQIADRMIMAKDYRCASMIWSFIEEVFEGKAAGHDGRGGVMALALDRVCIRREDRKAIFPGRLGE